MPREAVIIDLASAPGGCDFRYAENGYQSHARTDYPESWLQNSRHHYGQHVVELISEEIKIRGCVDELEWNNSGLCLTGSHCTLEEVMPQIQRFKDGGANVVPIVSSTIMTTDTRFGTSENWQKQLKDITGNDIILQLWRRNR